MTRSGQTRRATGRGRKRPAPAGARGLSPAEVVGGDPPDAVRSLVEEIGRDGGSIVGTYRDPLGGRWQVVAALPIDKVEPTPFQRDLSEAHVTRLGGVIDRLGRFLDPIIAVRAPTGAYWTPNGHHRLAALRRLGGRTILTLVVPEAEVAYQILALNTEKAHALREKALEVIRMARSLAALGPTPERDLTLQFEEAPLLTLGICYESNGRFSGGAYHALLRRIDEFLDHPLPRALEERERRAGQLLALDESVAKVVASLRERGLTSPYLKAFVVARINPLRFKRGASAPFGETLERMIESAERFDTSKIKPADLAGAAGPPEET